MWQKKINAEKIFFVGILVFSLVFTSLCVAQSTLDEDSKSDIKHTQMIYITGGSFEMGDIFNEGKKDENPVHKVRVDGFYMGVYEVTQKEYEEVMGSNPSERKGESLPVEVVRWYDAVEFCNKKSEQETLELCYTINGKNVLCNFDANGYRLPTEAEWEYAAREGGKKIRFGNGKNIAEPSGINFESSSKYKREYSVVGNKRGRIIEVGSLPPNKLGLYDMSGNVWEWVWDAYDSDCYQNSSTDNPQGASVYGGGILRGGSFGTIPQYLRVSYRYYLGAGSSDGSTGFRYIRKK